MERFEVVDVPEQRVATVRRVVPMAELPGFFGEAFHAVAAAVEAGGGAIAGPPFGAYYSMPTETVDVAAGFPVAGWDGDAGEVTVHARAGGRAVVTVHVGPYDTMVETYDARVAAVERRAGARSRRRDVGGVPQRPGHGSGDVAHPDRLAARAAPA
jgi:effector-binding domain-containing protein